MTDAISHYLSKVQELAKTQMTGEHSYRPDFRDFLQGFDKSIQAINEPQRIACGAPDFIVARGQAPLGYIEAKDLGKSLDKEEKSDQLKRYLGSLENLILTNYLEFRWYVKGKLRLAAKLAELDAQFKLRCDSKGKIGVSQLLNQFINTTASTVRTPKELARRMAAIARLIRLAIYKALTNEQPSGSLHNQMESFREVLLHDLKEDDFADLYAQTICYGLFSARIHTREAANFNRELAAYSLPKTNPFLRKTFAHIAGPDLDDRIVWAVDDLVELLKRSDMGKITKDFGQRMRLEDPVLHFYETFLSAYDKRMKKSRGVYYTPEPLVSFIIRSVDHVLKKDFSLKDGLADSSKLQLNPPSSFKVAQVHRVQILDPASGTGTFLFNILNHIHQSFRGNEGMWSDYVSKDLLPRLYGFELLVAPYAIAHLKIGLQLMRSGYDFHSDERLGVYLTNTLEESFHPSERLLLGQWLVQEAVAAGTVKTTVPIMVIVGNPPYSGHSFNPSEVRVEKQAGEAYVAKYDLRITQNAAGVKFAYWEPITRKLKLRKKEKGTKIVKQKTFIGRLIMDYLIVDNARIRDRNTKWLQDDYVKFIRFSQWRIEGTGSGVLGFVTNHKYLSNPSFGGMRQSLMNSFKGAAISCQDCFE